MSCCAPAAFAEYVVEEVEKIGLKLANFPLAYQDIWSELADLAVEPTVEDVLAAVAQAPGDLGVDDLLIDSLKMQITSVVSPDVIPILENQLLGVRTIQDAIKAIAAFIFIAYSDSKLHLVRILALKIVTQCGLKIASAGRLKFLCEGVGGVLGALEQTGVDSEEIRENMAAAAAEVAEAVRLVQSMSYRVEQGSEARQTSADRAIERIDAALALLAPPAANGADAVGVLASLGVGALLQGASLYLNEMKSTIAQYKQDGEKLNTLVLAFQVAITGDSADTMLNFQESMLKRVLTLLSETHASLINASRYSSAKDIAYAILPWVRDLNIAKALIAQLPPEVREAQEMNLTMITHYNHSVAMLKSITGDHIAAGIENVNTGALAANRVVSLAENLLDDVRTSKLRDMVDYVAVASSGSELGELSFVTMGNFLPVAGDPVSLTHYTLEGAALAETFAGNRDKISRLDESVIHAHLVVKAMDHYLSAPPSPGDAIVTILMGLLEALSMDRASDMLEMANLDSFMDSSPLQWTYLGTAIECLEEALKGAIDEGMQEIADEIDKILLPMWGAFNAIEIRFKKKSAFSLKSILEKLEASIEELEKTKDTVLSIVDVLDCS
jgi:hypothetical protein